MVRRTIAGPDRDYLTGYDVRLVDASTLAKFAGETELADRAFRLAAPNPPPTRSEMLELAEDLEEAAWAHQHRGA